MCKTILTTVAVLATAGIAIGSPAKPSPTFCAGSTPGACNEITFPALDNVRPDMPRAVSGSGMSVQAGQPVRTGAFVQGPGSLNRITPGSSGAVRVYLFAAAPGASNGTQAGSSIPAFVRGSGPQAVTVIAQAPCIPARANWLWWTRTTANVRAKGQPGSRIITVETRAIRLRCKPR